MENRSFYGEKSAAGAKASPLAGPGGQGPVYTMANHENTTKSSTALESHGCVAPAREMGQPLMAVPFGVEGTGFL